MSKMKMGTESLSARLARFISEFACVLAVVGGSGQSMVAQENEVDSIVQITAEAQGLALVPPDEVPPVGTFWQTTATGLVPVPFPCPPPGPGSIYQITDGQYLVDGTGGQSMSAAAMEAEATAVVNLIQQIEGTPGVGQSQGMAMAANSLSRFMPGDSGSAGDDGSMSSSHAAFTFDTNLLWLQITNISHGTAHVNLYNATNQVYAILSSTDLLTSFSVERELWPTDTNCMPFTVQTSGRQNLYLRAEDWTGLDSDGDGLPDWWEWKWFGNLAHKGSDVDADGLSLLNHYLNDEPIIIVQQPMSQNAYIGDTVVFSVQTLNGLDFQYQWKHDGTPIPGARSSSYTLANVQSSDAGTYTVDISYATYTCTSDETGILTISSIDDPNYREVIGSRVNYTFKSGYTYYIGANVPFYGNTVIQGGAILKFDWYYLASLRILGTLTCTGGPYQPAILTSVNDDSVGEYVCNGGSHSPNLDDNGNYSWPLPWPTDVPYLDMTDAQSAVISNLWFRFADIGVSTQAASRRLDVWDCQFFECHYGIVNLVAGTGAIDSLHNVLVSSSYADSAAVKAGSDAINIEAEQVTSDADYFCKASTTPHQVTLTNSLIWGNPVTASSLTTVDVQFNPPVADFVSVGEANYYLAPGSSFHSAGTAGISLRLQAELKGKTTSAPLAIAVNTTLTGDMTLAPQVQRYAGGQPDLGYYYDALDYTVANFNVSGGNLTVLPGTAVGIRNERWLDHGSYEWSTDGFFVSSGGTFISQGMPNKPEIFVDADLVQESLPNPLFVSSLDFARSGIRDDEYDQWGFAVDWFPAHHSFITDYEDGDATPPTLDFRFSNFYLPAEDMHIATGESYDELWWVSVRSDVNLNLRDCQLHGGQINLGKMLPDEWVSDPAFTSCNVTWLNSLFENVTINLDPDFYDPEDPTLYTDLSLTAYNNLFRGGAWLRLVPIPASAGNWTFHDNLFDQTEFWQDTSLPLDYGHNAYWPRQSSEVYFSDDATQLQPSTGGTLSGGPEPVLTAAPPYQTGPFGNYYLSAVTPLYQAGSRSAALAGLYHYTTQANQAKEANSPAVNIGLHYLAANGSGQPMDSDNDGIPDYVENWHGDGDTAYGGATRSHTADETDWLNEATDIDPDTLEPISDTNNAVYDDIDLSGDGLVGRVKAALGMTPLDPSNPLTLTPTGSGSDSLVFNVPINFGQIGNPGYLSLTANGMPISFERCDRNSIGKCQVTWNTTFGQPGYNLIQASFTVSGQSNSTGLGPLIVANLYIDQPPYAFSLVPGTADWNNASVQDRLASVNIPRDWQNGASSWQLYCSVVSSPYFRVIWVPGYPIADCYSASKNASVQALQILESQSDFGANNLRYLSGLDLAAMLNSGANDNNPCIIDYFVVCYMASLDASLNSMDQPSLQRLFRLAVWDANYFNSNSGNSLASGAVKLMYAIYNKPESQRGSLPVTLPPLMSDQIASLAQLDLPDELYPVVQSAQSALGLSSRP